MSWNKVTTQVVTYLAFAEPLYSFYGLNGTDIVISQNLQNWEILGSIPSFSSWVAGLAYGNGAWVVAGNQVQDQFYNQGFFYTCTSATPTPSNWKISFNEPNTVPSVPVRSMMFANNMFLGTDDFSSYNSSDGIAWTNAVLSEVSECFMEFAGPSSDDGRFYYVCDPLLTSIYGYNWTQLVELGLLYIDGVSYAYYNGKGQYIATGGGGRLLTSSDGVHFTKEDNINDSTGFNWVSSFGDAQPCVAVSSADNSIYTYAPEA